MSRLIHSEGGAVRALQISETVIFAYCEGKRNDPFFYRSILDIIESKTGIAAELKLIERETGTGGKKSSLAHFEDMRRKEMLDSVFKGKRMVCAYFLDKDADCVTGEIVDSKHIIYTGCYDVEAHIFRDTDLRAAIAIALSIEPSKVPSKMRDAAKWCEYVANLWNEWLNLCVFSQRHRINCGCGYSRPSLINGDGLGATDEPAYRTHIDKLRNKYEEKFDAFETAFYAVKNELEERRRRGVLFSLFKGKWIVDVLELDLRRQMPAEVGDWDGFRQRIASAALARLDFNGSWTSQYVDCLMRILASTPTSSRADRSA